MKTHLAERSILTRKSLTASPTEVWHNLLFYEDAGRRPPIYLRLLLPMPIRSDGPKPDVGDEVTCLYQKGYLKKRVTHVDAGGRYEFDVIEQHLCVGSGVKLLSGSYSLSELARGQTEITLTTRYASPKRPRWLWRPAEAAVCHMFHRHLLTAIRHNLKRLSDASPAGR